MEAEQDGGHEHLSDADWERLLDGAIEHGHLFPVHQPIVDLRRGTCAGFEALIRFPDRPSVSPEDWFAAARRLGRVSDLDAVALRAALGRRADLPRGCFLAVNVSPDTLRSGQVREVWQDHSDLSGLVVELTEQSRIDSYRDLEPELDQLRGLGALIAVDDAGSGYAGLNHLLAIRPSIIKLDRTLVADLDRDETKLALAEMVGTFASRIDAWLLAEGIERQGEMDALVRLGVPLAQGYYLAMPQEDWAAVRPELALHLLSQRRDVDADTVRDLIEVAPTVTNTGEAAVLLGGDALQIVVLLDGHDRPVCAIGPEQAALSLIEPGMRVNVDTPLVEAADRAMTRNADVRFAPLLCTDDAGRYGGIVRIERLVRALSARVGPSHVDTH